MGFFELYLAALVPVMALMVLLWAVSVAIRNASLVDPFWSIGFIVVAVFFFIYGEGNAQRKMVVLLLVVTWGLRLFVHLFKRFLGSEEDYRYRNFRDHYGPHRYWWVSLFQVFLLQGLLLWIISAPLLGAMQGGAASSPGMVDLLAGCLWLTGLVFEAGGDLQLARFRADPANKGKLMTRGLWKYTRHPNYFGDAMVWWAFGLFAVAAGAWWALPGPALMTFLLLKVSGVSMLERSLKEKPGYEDYMRRTPPFFPAFFRKKEKPGDGQD